MNVFISIPWFFPAYKAGGPIQSIVNLVNNFTEDIEYNIFCGDVDLNNEPLQNIVKGEWVQYNNYTKIWYAPKENLSDVLTTQIEILKPDVIYIIGLFDWHFNIVPLLFGKASKKILSVRGMLHPGALTQKKWKKRIFLQALKFFGIKNKITFHATDSAEEVFVKNKFGDNAFVVVAGNFSKSVVKSDPLQKEVGYLQMVTIALISPMKNHLQVLKGLANCTANIFYNIYGPVKDAVYWKECTEQIKLLPKNINVQYYGELLPQNVENILKENHVFIMPSKSENFGHSIAEALAAGKPVITSHTTPWNNLQQHNSGINLQATQEEICNAVNFFASLNNDEYKKYTEAARKYSDDRINKNEKINAYKKLFFNKV